MDVEAQKNPNPGYNLINRGIFYAGRMLSEQMGRNISGQSYSTLEKVYSIWLCFNCANKVGNTISTYKIDQEPIYGDYLDDNFCDFVRIVMIRVPKEGEIDHCRFKPSKIHQLLYKLFVRSNDAYEKLKIMEDEFGIETSILEEEVNTMCNLSEGIREEAEAKKEKDILTVLAHNLQLENPKLSVEEAFEKAKRYITVML